MWWLVLGAGAALLLKKIVTDWGWEREWKVDDIRELPKKPGIYVMYNRRNKIIHVGSSKNLRQRLSGHPKKSQMTSFDWYQTGTTQEAKRLEKQLQQELEYPGR